MDTKNRIAELQEKMQEFILNEAVFDDENPSWEECAIASNEAERKWNETEEGKELARLLINEISYFFNTSTAQFVQLANTEKKENFNPFNKEWVKITAEAFERLMLTRES